MAKSSAGRKAGGAYYTGSYHAKLNEPAKTSSEHAVQARVLVGELGEGAKRSGEAVWVKVGDKRVVATLWALPSLPPGQAKLSNELVNVVRLWGCAKLSCELFVEAVAMPALASSVVLVPSDESLTETERRAVASLAESVEASAYAAYSLQGAVVSPLTPVALMVAGATMVFTVKHVGSEARSSAEDDTSARVFTVDTTTKFSFQLGGQVSPTAPTTITTTTTTASTEANSAAPDLEPMAGVDATLNLLASLITTNLDEHRQQRLRALGLDRVKGALVSGPTGSGKSLLVQHLAQRLHLTLITLPGASLSPQKLEEAFRTQPSHGASAFAAAAAAPPSRGALILLDDVDVGCPSRSSSSSTSVSRISTSSATDTVASLLVLMDTALPPTRLWWAPRRLQTLWTLLSAALEDLKLSLN